MVGLKYPFFCCTKELEEAIGIMLQRAFSYEYNWVLVPYLEYINSDLQWDENTQSYKDINSYTAGNTYSFCF
jgi:hypothetical protein